MPADSVLSDFIRGTVSQTDAGIGLSTLVGDFGFCQYDWLCILLGIIAVILFAVLWRRKRKIKELEDELKADGRVDADEGPVTDRGE